MTAGGIDLRAGGGADIDAVMAVMSDSFDRRYGEAWTAPQCAGLLPMPGVWLTLASDHAGAIGFSLSRVVANEAELLLLAVRSSTQRRGVGKMLLQRFIEDAKKRGADRLHLEVREGNHAVKLYEEFGFALVGRRRNYYSGPDGRCYDALTMAKIVDGLD
ncbi:ribosomal protein S18-alanine N-acetyltransferase [Sphingosinicella terrae]|uniref:ribosomal protein S18-alanine N-acetyltransferase n=1 Tax=Sphingosinicella terrae TaxID=2172047 RepID=UPI000E0D0AF6|nr:ribosomal protein S18-alanine N-acetyltransferase [Sphingosinicella terrae]